MHIGVVAQLEAELFTAAHPGTDKSSSVLGVTLEEFQRCEAEAFSLPSRPCRFTLPLPSSGFDQAPPSLGAPVLAAEPVLPSCPRRRLRRPFEPSNVILPLPPVKRRRRRDPRPTPSSTSFADVAPPSPPATYFGRRPNGRLLRLPSDVLVIFTYLSAPDLVAQVELCSSQMLAITRDDRLWADLCRRDFPNATGWRVCSTPWRHVYRCRADKTKVNKYKNEPSHVRDLYMEMEAALDYLRSPTYSQQPEPTAAPLPPDLALIVAQRQLTHPDCPAPTIESSDPGAGRHICLPGVCKFERLSEELFLCLEAGVVHVCRRGATCSRADISDRDAVTLVCPISGRVVVPKWAELRKRSAHLAYEFALRDSASRMPAPPVGQDLQMEDPEDNNERGLTPGLQIADEGEEWAMGGFLGRCFARGYDCINEQEFCDFRDDYF